MDFSSFCLWICHSDHQRVVATGTRPNFVGWEFVFVFEIHVNQICLARFTNSNYDCLWSWRARYSCTRWRSRQASSDPRLASCDNNYDKIRNRSGIMWNWNFPTPYVLKLAGTHTHSINFILLTMHFLSMCRGEMAVVAVTAFAK